MTTKNLTPWERRRQNRSAAQIQAEITLMRHAYQRREARHQSLNRLLGEPLPPLLHALPYLASILISLTIIGLIISHL